MTEPNGLAERTEPSVKSGRTGSAKPSVNVAEPPNIKKRQFYVKIALFSTILCQFVNLIQNPKLIN